MVNGIRFEDMCSLKTCDNRPLERIVDEDNQDGDEINIGENCD